MPDKRLDDLSAELVLMVETSNEEIADLDRRIAALQQERGEKFIANLERINQQRGRIMEREHALAEQATVLDALEANDPYYSDPPHNPNITRLPITNEREKEA